MKYYKSIHTGKIVTYKFVKGIDYVSGKGTIDQMIENGALIEVKNPTIEECIKNGAGMVAVVRYRELHPSVDWETAMKKVKNFNK